MRNKRLESMQEEYQELMIGSNGIQTEEIKELGRRIDDELEFVKQKDNVEVKG